MFSSEDFFKVAVSGAVGYVAGKSKKVEPSPKMVLKQTIPMTLNVGTTELDVLLFPLKGLNYLASLSLYDGVTKDRRSNDKFNQYVLDSESGMNKIVISNNKPTGFLSVGVIVDNTFAEQVFVSLESQNANQLVPISRYSLNESLDVFTFTAAYACDNIDISALLVYNADEQDKVKNVFITVTNPAW
jgi:hypothetical protein